MLRLFLVDLERDVSEMRNFADDYPERTRELQRLHSEWTKELGID